MRTTLTLDEDVAEQLARLSRETHASFKAVVNETLRRGLRDGMPAAERPKFKVRPHRTGGLLPGIDDRKLNEFADQLEDERLLR